MERMEKNGDPISKHQLAKMLKPYSIKPKNIKINTKNLNGYEFDKFKDVFERYITP